MTDDAAAADGSPGDAREDGGQTDGTVDAVFDAIAETVPELREGLVHRRGTLDSENPSGETQLAADEWADSLFAERLTAIDGVGEYASEERADVHRCGSGYAVAMDPLDGSSNLPSNNPVGSIVGVYDGSLPTRGRNLVGAGYVLYGSVTTMTVATGGDVSSEVVVDGERRPVETGYTLPENPTVYGFGGSQESWYQPFREYADEVTSELKLRYSGALVADVNQVREKGGVFAYPRKRSRPEGKLRHQFEANPIAYVIEAAGGRSSDGQTSLLDRPVTDLHGRTPVVVGSPEYVDRLERRVARAVAQ